jgi:LPXTG-motif cell wall-anchored protein
MGKTLLARLFTVVAGGTVALIAAAPAVAAQEATTVDLRQAGVTAGQPEFDLGFGKCEEKPDQAETEDVWVFVWPGNDVEELVSLTLNFDSDGDGTADTTLTEADATATLDQGTLKVWVTTPAGWTLIDGTSQVIGEVPRPKFNLTHSCAGQPGGGNGTPPPPTPTPTPSPGATPPGGENGNGGEDDNGESDDQLPVTGMQVGGMVLLGAGLLAAGIAMLAVRRHRRLPDLADS